MRAYPQLCHSGEVGSSVSLARRVIVEVLVSSLLCCLAATDSWTLFVSPTANRRISDFFYAFHLGRRSALHTTLYRTVPPTAQAPTPLLLMLPHFCCYCARRQPLGPPPPRATLRKQTIVYKIAIFRALKTTSRPRPKATLFRSVRATRSSRTTASLTRTAPLGRCTRASRRRSCTPSFAA